MAETSPERVRIFLTPDPLAAGTIPEAMAEIAGVAAVIGEPGTNRLCIAPEGIAWHRTRWAAQNYACQIRDAMLAELRAEIDRLERMDFGLRR